MTYFILAWLAVLSAAEVAVFFLNRPLKNKGADRMIMKRPAHGPGSGGAYFVQPNRVEEIIKGSDKPVSLSDVLV